MRDYAGQRRRMVDRQIRRRGISDQRVLDAMLTIPREEFVPPSCRDNSYEDDPTPIGAGQTISQPYMNALMAQSLELTGMERVLDVGAGTGYMAALLGALAARVIAIELVPELAAAMRENLARTGLDGNIVVICGDGSVGAAGHAPFQGISVDAAAPEVPWRLLDQLDDPGRLVIPVGSREDQELRIVSKERGFIETRVATYCRFVPLLGAGGWEKE